MIGPDTGTITEHEPGSPGVPVSPESTGIELIHDYSDFMGTLYKGSYESSIAGGLSYEKMHPPNPDQSAVEYPDLQAAVLSTPNPATAIGNLGQYWADQIGTSEPVDKNFFANEYNSLFQDDVTNWKSDWGVDPSWHPTAAPSPDAWKQHGGKRKGPAVDLSYMTAVEQGFKSLETALGYQSETDLVAEVFPGYGEEINEEALADRGSNPEKVIGTPDDTTGELMGGELIKSDNASGAWGEYLTGVNQVKDIYDLDETTAKDSYKAELKNIRAQKKALGRQTGTGLRGVTGKGSLTGLRRGGRRAGGFRRGDVSGIQDQARQLGGLREKARLTYNNKLDRLKLDKKQSIEGKANSLRAKVETEFTELAGDLKVAEINYQSDSLDLETERADSILDVFQVTESLDPGIPWPQHPDKG